MAHENLLHLQQLLPAETSLAVRRVRCCAAGQTAIRWLTLVAVILLGLILWLLSYSGFQHDFLRWSSNDQYRSDIPLTVCASALACVLLRIPAVVKRLRRRRYSVWGTVEARGMAWLMPVLFMLLIFAGGILNRIRGGMTGPMWGLCHGKHDVKGDDACGGFGDFVGRWGISLASGVLISVLGGGNGWLGCWFAWFMYLGNVPDWGCYFTMAQGPDHVPATSHLDCAHEPRRGLFDWLIGKSDFIIDQSYEVRLMRDWCGMWMRGLVWLGPAGLGVRAAGFDSTLAIGGGLMPVFYKMDTWFFTGAADFGTGSPMGELMWGFMMYTMLVACMLGSEEPLSKPVSSRARSSSLPFSSVDATSSMQQLLLADAGSLAEAQRNARPDDDDNVLASLLCEDFPPVRRLCGILNTRIRLAAEVVCWCSLVCTVIGAVSAHIAAIDHTAWG
jgi:hypothetical protein